MANCSQCGAKLSSFSFGEASPYCKTCRSQLADVPAPEKPETVDALPVQSSFAANPTPATYLLLAINIVVFLAMLAFGISAINPDTDKVLQWGADFGPYTLGGQYWRLITSMFIHFGIIHIFGNMWCLWSLGRLAEKLLGSFSVVATYLLTGVGASLLSLSWDPMRISAGASGAIFGIAGVLITTLYYGKHNLQPESVRRLLGYVVRFSVLNLLFGLRGHVDNSAHAGGLVTGLLIGLFVARTFASSPEEQGTQRRTIMAVSALVLLVLFVPLLKPSSMRLSLAKGKQHSIRRITRQPPSTCKNMSQRALTMSLPTPCLESHITRCTALTMLFANMNDPSPSSRTIKVFRSILPGFILASTIQRRRYRSSEKTLTS